MQLGIQIVVFMFTVAFMEGSSYAMHRWLFHGPFWFLHASHHQARHGAFEWNDIFPTFFAAISIFLFADGFGVENRWLCWPVAIGMTTYGFLYFLAHDVYTHKRYFNLNLKWSLLQRIRSVHRGHHQDASKAGREPFGLFWY